MDTPPTAPDVARPLRSTLLAQAVARVTARYPDAILRDPGAAALRDQLMTQVVVGLRWDKDPVAGDRTADAARVDVAWATVRDVAARYPNALLKGAALRTFRDLLVEQLCAELDDSTSCMAIVAPEPSGDARELRHDTNAPDPKAARGTARTSDAGTADEPARRTAAVTASERVRERVHEGTAVSRGHLVGRHDRGPVRGADAGVEPGPRELAGGTRGVEPAPVTLALETPLRTGSPEQNGGATGRPALPAPPHPAPADLGDHPRDEIGRRIRAVFTTAVTTRPMPNASLETGPATSSPLRVCPADVSSGSTTARAMAPASSSRNWPAGPRYSSVSGVQTWDGIAA